MSHVLIPERLTPPPRISGTATLTRAALDVVIWWAGRWQVDRRDIVASYPSQRVERLRRLMCFVL